MLAEVSNYTNHSAYNWNTDISLSTSLMDISQPFPAPCVADKLNEVSNDMTVDVDDFKNSYGMVLICQKLRRSQQGVIKKCKTRIWL